MVNKRGNFTLSQFIEKKATPKCHKKNADANIVTTRKPLVASTSDYANFVANEVGKDKCQNFEESQKCLSPSQRKPPAIGNKENYWYYDSSSDGIYYEFNGVRGWRKRNAKQFAHLNLSNQPLEMTNGKIIKQVDGYFFESPSAEGWRRIGGPPHQQLQQPQQQILHHQSRRQSANFPPQNLPQLLGTPAMPVPSKCQQQPFALSTNFSTNHQQPNCYQCQQYQPKQQELQQQKENLCSTSLPSSLHNGTSPPQFGLDKPNGSFSKFMDIFMRQYQLPEDNLDSQQQLPSIAKTNPWEPKIDDDNNSWETLDIGDKNKILPNCDKKDRLEKDDLVADWTTNGYESPLFNQLSTIRPYRPSTDSANKFDMEHIEAAIESMLNFGGDEAIGGELQKPRGR